MTFKITVAYDGTDFVGWQRQAQGTSIQSLLETALQVLDQREITVTGAGRTDAGVHARGQVAHFSLARSIEPTALVGALNARLPDAVRVVAAEVVPDTFHARFDALRKTYRYRIWNADVLSPFERRFAWHLSGVLDCELMAAAAKLIEGQHDFAAFQGAGSTARSTVRNMFASRLKASRVEGKGQGGEDPLIVYEVAGNGFLRHMVRTIVGTLVEIGRGRRAVESMREVLSSRDRALAGPTAPPEGLVLLSVEYPAPLLAGDR